MIFLKASLADLEVLVLEEADPTQMLLNAEMI
jgi:hypothetical protein